MIAQYPNDCFKPQRMLWLSLSLVSVLTVWSPTLRAESSSDWLKQLQSLQSGDKANQTATTALKNLNSAKDVSLIQVLSAMKGANPIGRNWLLGLASSLYRKSGKDQTAELEKFLSDVSQDGEARYLVFGWLTSGNEVLRDKLLAKLTQDPSPELRFMAIEEELKDETIEANELKSLLESARHPDQVVGIIKKLKEKDVDVDQAKQFGFLCKWTFIGPFDHVGSANFDKVFPVEADWIAGAVKKEYEGKNGPVKWLEDTTDSPEGAFDVAALYNNEKGCIVYAMTEFDSDKDQDVDIRLGCINGNKTWVNGKLVMSNEVYHTNMQIDQYNATVRFKAGKNRILVKLCQNEQKEQWAQRFAFQLRVSDSTGKAILEKGR